jgi:hypothetical protein
LLADSGPSLVESAVEPKARLVAKEDHPPARSRFFLIAGKVFLSQTACR